MSISHIHILRTMLRDEKGVILPGAPNALAARIVADLGFQGGVPDRRGAHQYVSRPAGPRLYGSEPGRPSTYWRSAASVDLPLIVDADTGFGNAINVQRTVATFERAGASAIQLEDQVTPKRCGHLAGKGLISPGEMVGKVRAALAARRDPATLIIARTDAIAVEGFEAAIERAGRYIEAGADVTFVEAPRKLSRT